LHDLVQFAMSTRSVVEKLLNLRFLRSAYVFMGYPRSI